MSRDVRLYLEDILEACDRVHAFTAEMDRETFLQDAKTQYAVAYALLAIGEAAKHVPASVRSNAPDVDWRRMAGMRDVLAHGYFVVKLNVVWDVVVGRLPELRRAVQRILTHLPGAGA